MTITSLDSQIATTGNHDITGKFRSLIPVIMTAIREYRETLRANRPQAFYHNHKAENLERARRDVNRVWQNHI